MSLNFLFEQARQERRKAVRKPVSLSSSLSQELLDRHASVQTAAVFSLTDRSPRKEAVKVDQYAGDARKKSTEPEGKSLEFLFGQARQERRKAIRKPVSLSGGLSQEMLDRHTKIQTDGAFSLLDDLEAFTVVSDC